MADPVSLSLAALQVVVPVAMYALPPIWERIVAVLKHISTIKKDYIHSTNLVCINVILDTLEQVPNLNTMLSHNQGLLNKIKLKAEDVEEALIKKALSKMALTKMALSKMALSKMFFRSPKDRISQDIKDIIVMMQLLDVNIRTRQGHGASKQYNVNAGVEAHQRKMKHLTNDLHAKLDEDNLEPVKVKTIVDFINSMKKSGTYPKVCYHFDHQSPETVYPKILTVSRSVRECIEVLLKWLRDLKDINNGDESSLVVGVAFFELFTETLPQVLMEHLTRSRRIRQSVQNAQQFHTNLCFLRSFATSDAFMRFQGEDGLQLEEKDKAKLDLQHSLWKTWEDVQIESGKRISQFQGNNPSQAGVGGPALPPSGTSHFFEGQTYSNLHAVTRVLREAHSSNCCLEDANCPSCGIAICHLSIHERTEHVNDCMDTS